MIPGYSGHIPGLYSDVGHTYGSSTRTLSPPRAQTAQHATRDTARPLREGRVPGYRGYVPGMVNSFEHTYGSATREALTEFKAKTEAASKLSAVPPRDRYYERGTPILPADIPLSHRPSSPDAPRTRAFDSSDTQDFRPIPGYSGFIPNMRDLRLERTYSQAVQAAITRRRAASLPRTAGAVSSSITGSTSAGDARDQQQKGAAPSTAPRRDSASGMDALVPAPKRLPGYQGYIPRSLHALGETYGKMAERAFSSRPETPQTPPPPADQGSKAVRALPGYTGHIPAYKEQFGRSYRRAVRA